MLEGWALALVGSPWIFVVLYLFATIDGFFPPIPSESTRNPYGCRNNESASSRLSDSTVGAGALDMPFSALAHALDATGAQQAHPLR